MNTRAKIGLGLLGLLLLGLFLLWYLGVFDEFLGGEEDSKTKKDEGGASEVSGAGGTPPPTAPPAAPPSPSALTLSPPPSTAPPAAPAKCGRSATIVDAGYTSRYNGWYDVENCGKKNRYCRWIGVFDAGDPAISTAYVNGLDQNTLWICSTSSDGIGNYQPSWNASYVRSDTEQY